jgi:nitrate/nitrite transport system substrate-binding protein
MDIYRPALYMEAAELLIEEGNLSEADVPMDTDGFRPITGEGDFIDGKAYDGHKPNEYIESFTIRAD